MLPLVALGFALAVSPGPDFLLILRNTLASGRAIGYMTLLGNRLSLCLHVALAIGGLSIALQASEALYGFVRLLGAGYLGWLGVRMLAAWRTGAARSTQAQRAERVGAGVALRQGFLSNLLNPKVSLFFVSLFPQFTTHEMLADSPGSVAALFLLGNSSWWVLLVAVAGSPAVRAAIARIQAMLDAVFGLLFVGLGAKIVLEALRRF